MPTPIPEDPTKMRRCGVCGKDYPQTLEFFTSGGGGNIRPPCRQCDRDRRSRRRDPNDRINQPHSTFKAGDPDSRAKAASDLGHARKRAIAAARAELQGSITEYLLHLSGHTIDQLLAGEVDIDIAAEIREWTRIILDAIPAKTVEINNQRLLLALEKERRAATDGPADPVPTAGPAPDNGGATAIFGPPPDPGAGVHPER